MDTNSIKTSKREMPATIVRPWASLSLNSHSNSSTNNNDNNNSNGNHNSRDTSSTHTSSTLSISLEDEQLYLRVREYHALANEIDHVLQATIDKQLGELVVAIDAKFLKLLPPSHDVKNDHNHDHKRKRIEEDATNTNTNTTNDPYCHSHAQYIVEASQHYNPATLPVVKLRAPHNILDQHHLSNSLVPKLKQSKPRRAVCLLSRSFQTSNNNSNHCGPLLREIVRQCIEQDDCVLPFHINTTKRNSMQQQQHIDLLRFWARHTKRFSELVVILQGTTAQTLSTRVMQAFLHLLERLRREDGCAIQLIWIASTPIPPLEGNLLISTMALPSSEYLVNQLWHGLTTTTTLLTLSPTVISCIHSCFQNQHRSFVKVVVALKQSIALQLSMPGSLAMVPACCHEENSRLDWFECTDLGRKALLGQHATTTATATGGNGGDNSLLELKRKREMARNLERTLRSGMQALQFIQQPQMASPPPLPVAAAASKSSTTSTSTETPMLCMDLMQSLAHPHRLPTMARKLTDNLQLVAASDRTALLLRIESARCALLEWHDTHDKQEARSSHELEEGDKELDEECAGIRDNASCSSLLDAVTATNEIIVLVAQHYFLDKDGIDNDTTMALRNSEQERFQEDFWHSIYEWILGLLQMTSAATLELDKLHYNNINNNAVSHYQYIADSLMVPHRRHVTSALMANNNTHHQLANVYQIPSILFRLIADRVAIPRQDWFQLYKEWMEPQDLEEAWLLFCLGVYQLIHVGLIREKSRGGKNAQSVYEKAALVWSSGE